MRLIFDSHLDLAWNALSYNRDQTDPLDEINHREDGMSDFRGRGRATTCLPEMRRGGFAACLGTILVRAKRHVQPASGHRRIDLDHASPAIAYAVGQGQLAYYRLLETQGELRMLRRSGELRDHWSQWVRHAEQLPEGGLPPTQSPPVGMVLAMEGADPIAAPGQLARWWEDGLRSLMLAHYGQSHYAVGTGESGPLTSWGIQVLDEMRRVGMILDATHLCDESFLEALERFDGPVMASHTNCRALVPGGRQFSDEQLQILLERDAVIGVALDAWMLVPGWQRGVSTPDGLTLEAVADHIDRICQMAGSARHAAIGSDLDGGFGHEQTPSDVKSIADVGRLGDVLSERGYRPEDVDLILHGNWLRFFLEHLPA
jgi:membrane dipeptidase